MSLNSNAGNESTQIFVQHGETRLGPFSPAEARRRLKAGELRSEEPAWCPGLPAWSTLGALLNSLPEPEKRSGPGMVSAGIAVLGVVSGVAMFAFALHASQQRGGGQRPAFLFLGLLTIGLFCLCTAGTILGLLGCVTRTRGKVWSVLGMLVNAVVVVSLAGVLWLGIQKVRNQVRVQAARRLRAAGQAATDGVASRDIQFPATARTRAQNLELLRKWYDVKWTQAYQTTGRHDPRWDQPALQLLRDCAARNLEEPSGMTAEERFRLSRELLGLGCDDPLVLFLCGHAQFELHSQMELETKAVKGLAGAGYAPSVQFNCYLELAEICGTARNDRGVLEADHAALEALRAILARNEFPASETYVLKTCVRTGFGEKFFERHGNAVCEALEMAPGVERWLSLLCRGDYYVNEAWKARGSGYASSVTEAGWRGFGRNLQLAKDKLTESWKLNPGDPSAAVRMIGVAMGLGTDTREQMRLWFDRAVAAEIDNEAAYHTFLWGLRPRWSGSHADMLDFGRACLRTGRYDTRIPRQFLTAVQDIYSELDDEPDAIYQNPDVYRDLREMFEHYVQEPTKAKWRDYYRSQYAIVAYHAGDFSRCRELVEQVNFKFSRDVYGEWKADALPDIGKICALTGPARNEVEAGEKAYRQRRARSALQSFTAAEKLSAGDARGLAFIRGRKAAMAIEQGLENGEWVNFLPPADLSGWEASVGEWSALSTNLVEAKSGVKGMMIKSLARVGPDFEAKGEIEFVSSTTGDVQAGVIFGHPGMDRSDWESFRIKNTRREGEVAYFSRHFGKPEKSTPAHVPKVNTFHIQVWHGRMSATLNGEKIISQYAPANQGGLVNDENAEVGLGGYSDQNESVVRYRNVQIRKLTHEPKEP